MKYAVFYGRFLNFHAGHKYIIKKVAIEKNVPVKIMVRKTDEVPFVWDRCQPIRD